jgi:hypothetical protein
MLASISSAMSAMPTGTGSETGVAPADASAGAGFAATLDEVSPPSHAALANIGIESEAVVPVATAMTPGNDLPGGGKAAATTGREGDAPIGMPDPVIAGEVTSALIPGLLVAGGEPTLVMPKAISMAGFEGRPKPGAPISPGAAVPGVLPALSDSVARVQSGVESVAALPAGDGEAVAVTIRAPGIMPPESSPASALTQLRALGQHRDGGAAAPPQGTAAGPIAPGPAGAEVASVRVLADRDGASGAGIEPGQADGAAHAAPDRVPSLDRAAGSATFISAAGATAANATDRASVISAQSPAARHAPFNAVDAVANVVDRLFEARALGPAGTARMAVVHAEFGQLDITFARSGSTVDVAVTAANSESQAALAAALQSADRGSGRDQAAADSGSRNAAASHRGSDGSANPRDGDHQSGSPHTDPRRASRNLSAAASATRADEAEASHATDKAAGRAGIYA